MDSAIKRHGGKHYQAKHIIQLMRPHKRYCEAFFGSGAVMLQKECEGIAEFANDKDKLLSNFWKTLADEDAFWLFQRMITMQPFSKDDFYKAKDRQRNELASWHYTDDVANARDFFIVNRQSRQGLGKDFATPTTRIRAGMNENVSAWLSAVDGLYDLHNRIKRIEIWNEDAITFIDKLDCYGSCHYLDPPYLHNVRSTICEYGEYEMTIEQHCALLDYLNRGMRGDVLISGYPSELYNEKLKHWRHVDIEIDNKASSSSIKEMKIERVWMNYESK